MRQQTGMPQRQEKTAAGSITRGKRWISPWAPFSEQRFVRRLMGSAGSQQLEPGGVGLFHQSRLLVKSVRFFRVACCLPPLVEPLFGKPSIRQLV